MEAIDCIRSRRSIRAFEKKPVPRELLEEAVGAACSSPSYKNSQPWEVVIVSGEKKDALSSMLVELHRTGAEPTPDLPAPESWPPAEKARIDHLYQTREEATGINLRDPEIVSKSKVANFRFYGAPHAVYLLQENALSLWSLFDLGLFAQSFMLAAHGLGLGSVPQAFATDYARETKEFLGLPAGKRLVLGLSVGYPDGASPMNALATDRSPVGDILTWLE